MKEVKMERLLYTPQEVADAIGIGKSRLYTMLKNGEIPSIRIGNSIRIPADAFRQWVERLSITDSKPQGKGDNP